MLPFFHYEVMSTCTPANCITYKCVHIVICIAQFLKYRIAKNIAKYRLLKKNIFNGLETATCSTKFISLHRIISFVEKMFDKLSKFCPNQIYIT